MMKVESRRQINFQFNTKEFIENLNLLANDNLDKVAHDCTLAYLLERLVIGSISKLRRRMINRLIRMRCLERLRLLGRYYLITIDGTGHLLFKERHCEHCLVTKINGKEYYYHNVLEAKLVGANGLALSILSEFIENPNEKYDKQDCELKAFYRLAENLKRDFPQLPICLSLDSLYLKKPVFDICKENKWKYIITFKEGSMPATYAEYISLKSLCPENIAHLKRDEIEQDYHWVNDIDYQDHLLGALECNELKPGKDNKKEHSRFVWISNLEINKATFKEIAQGGRLRWKTENEGFNTQKNGGYNMEHAYSQDELAAKNFYLLLQIAHIINQLMEKGSLLKEEDIQKVFGSIRNIARKLLEDFRTKATTLAHLQNLLSVPFQIRFDWYFDTS
ncbi:MAG: transposase [bacterium]